jgi:hypothetical protein
MPFQKGKSGNPGGRSTEKEYQAALRAAVNVEDPRTKRRKLHLIAEKAADLAVAGEAWAVAHVADRLDGKPAQESTVTIDDKRDATDWTRDELVAFLNDARNGSGRTAKANGRGDGPDSVH